MGVHRFYTGGGIRNRTEFRRFSKIQYSATTHQRPEVGRGIHTLEVLLQSSANFWLLAAGNTNATVAGGGQEYQYCPHWTGIILTLWPEGISSARTDHLFQEGLVLLIWRRRAKCGRSFAKEVGMGNPAEENDRAPNRAHFNTAW